MDLSPFVKSAPANCQGLRDTKKRTDVINNLANLESNILCPQDMHAHWVSNDETVLKDLWPGECLINGYKNQC